MQCISLKRRNLVVSALAGILQPSARADLYDDFINSTSRLPFIAFLARRGVPGHAFLGVGVALDAGLIVYERFFGYYPNDSGLASAVKLVFGKTNGAIDYKWRDMSWDEKYFVNVNDAGRAVALGVVDMWLKGDPKYNLLASGGKNCSSFVAEVATAIGLQVPEGAGSVLPAEFIQLLRMANGG